MSSNAVMKHKSNTQSRVNKRKLLIIAGVALLLLVVFDLSPVGGNSRFYSKWASCGQKPVGTNLEWQVGGGSIPYYGDPPVVSFMRLSPDYFCTALQAEQAGYSASPDQYEFPELDKNR